MNNSPQRAAKGFTRAFWVSNTVELFERMAYYAVFIVLTIYLSSILGFNDFEASMISGLFSGGLYLLPIFSGAYADKIGFRKSMIIAFSLLSIGYLGLGVFLSLRHIFRQVLPLFLVCQHLVDELYFPQLYNMLFLRLLLLKSRYYLPAYKFLFHQMNYPGRCIQSEE